MIRLVPKTIDLSRSTLPGEEQREIQRFAEALRRAMIKHQCSERRLATELGITIGTTQKYFKGMINPLKVATGINEKLAGLLGITLTDLVGFYRTGQASSGVELPQVLSWVRSNAGMEHMAQILLALAEVGGGNGKCGEKEAPVQPFTWPLEELENAIREMAEEKAPGLYVAIFRDRIVASGETIEDVCNQLAKANDWPMMYWDNERGSHYPVCPNEMSRLVWLLYAKEAVIFSFKIDYAKPPLQGLMLEAISAITIHVHDMQWMGRQKAQLPGGVT
jgi:transcriptional regulator with XRE-family HTH domain